MKCLPCFAAVLVWNAVVSAEDSVDYATQIKPVLQARCYACHGALKQESGLRLDTVALAIKGGDGGPALKPGDVAASVLLARVSAADESERMPPEGEPLKPAEIAALRTWIAQGAQAPPDEQPERDPREHWAFKAPIRPAVPNVDQKLLGSNFKPQNPIDAFLAAEWTKRGLVPQRPADPRILLRRVYLDLIGLPPTRDELESFVNDSSPDAYERVVTRLLDSPQYGERWGRHWMDLWRYSDWWGLGAEVRNSQKHLWHWRDWIIESLNADVGYDEMLRQMLAADELYPNDLDRLRATGYLARQYFKFNRTSWLDETIEHTSKAFLGLTLNCGKCHDHKYDPFGQVEYYRLRAIFEPYQVRTEMVPGEVDLERDGIPRAFDCNLDAPTFLHIRGDDRRPDRERVIEPGLPAFLTLADEPLKIEPVRLPIEAQQPGLRPFVLDTHLNAAERAIAEARKSVEEAQKKFDAAQTTAVSSTAEKPSTKDTATAATFATGGIIGSLKPELWEPVSGQWKWQGDKVLQTEAGTERSALRLKKPAPENFQAALKFRITGGQMWKSLGIAFDVAGETNEVLAYMSAVAGGSKLQIAHRSGSANYSYPPDGALAYEVRLDTPYELAIRVRGTLINVAIDGKHVLAYRLPVARKAGALALITYDATAEFLSFELSELGAEIKLVETGRTKSSDGPPTVDEAKAALVVAEKALAAAELEPATLRARAAADQARFATPSAANATELAQAAARAEKRLAVARADVELARSELERIKAPDAKKAEAEKKIAAARVALDAARKAAEAPGEAYSSLRGALKTLESNLETEASRSKPFPATSTGRRTALAKWLTDRRHPLTARVAVNHLWMRHFGRPLVPTVFDFGRKGQPPSHPELLDWLAVEFMDTRWSMKHVHRLMVTSAAYRQSSSSEFRVAGSEPNTRNAQLATRNVQLDPENRFYWRRNPVRMEAQILRDSLLFLAGELDLTLGGPSIPVTDENSRRRSVYFVHSKNDRPRFLEMFDNASVLECYRRAESIVPQQALALENSSLAVTMSSKIVARLQAGLPAASDDEFVRAAFVTVLAAEPTADELDVCRSALLDLRALLKSKNVPDIESRARLHLVQSLLNHNDFVTIR